MRWKPVIAAGAIVALATFLLIETRPLTRLEHRLRELAGRGVIDCGTIKPRGDARSSSKCALEAFANNKPFYVIYDVQEFMIDSYFIDALAGDKSGNVYDVEFSSNGWSPADAVGSKLFDGRKILVEACSKPAALKKSVYGGLTCLPRLTEPTTPK